MLNLRLMVYKFKIQFLFQIKLENHLGHSYDFLQKYIKKKNDII